MANPIVNTYAKGQFISWFKFPNGNDNVLAIPIQLTGIPTDNVLRNCQTLAAIFTAGALEATFTNYSRKLLTAADVTITYDLVTNFCPTVSFPNVLSWPSAGGAVNNVLAAILLAYRPSPSTPDSGCFPISVMSYTGNAVGGTLTATLGTLKDQ